MSNSDDIKRDLERIFHDMNAHEGYLAAMWPDRPYDGQPHTSDGSRGRTEVRGVTVRDIHDCYIIGCYRASGLMPEKYPPTIYDLPWDEIDPLAVWQNMSCAIEQKMGVFPALGKEARHVNK